tara:strand:- start:239 stop:709 length:471 start_codon:yes stop_codon:yes gene_type:complete
MDNFQGTCIAFDEEAVLFRGPSGCGKSDLALRCINQGATLISDDQTILCKKNKKIFASAPTTIAGKLEVRGLGIVEFPYIERARLALVLDLVNEDTVERLPDINFVDYFDLKIPNFRLYPFQCSAVEKISLAIDLFKELKPNSFKLTRFFHHPPAR